MLQIKASLKIILIIYNLHQNYWVSMNSLLTEEKNNLKTKVSKSPQTSTN